VSELQTALNDVKAAHLDLLYSRCASKLTGRKVQVGRLSPDDHETRGAIVKRAGQLFIMLNPGLDPGEKFKSFLHECAHGLLHYDHITDETAQPIPGAKALTPSPLIQSIRAEIIEGYEREAQQQAQEWLALAGDGSIKERLLRLLG
jgi:hypothetical protein